jgi:hypothetical protein
MSHLESTSSSASVQRKRLRAQRHGIIVVVYQSSWAGRAFAAAIATQGNLKNLDFSSYGIPSWTLNQRPTGGENRAGLMRKNLEPRLPPLRDIILNTMVITHRRVSYFASLALVRSNTKIVHWIAWKLSGGRKSENF